MRSEIFTLALILLLAVLTAQAEENAEGWQKSADLGLNLTQSDYSNSWEGSESGTISWTFNANLMAARQLNPKTHWKNELKLLYGETHRQVDDEEDDSRRWESPEKSTDRIFFESLMEFTLGAFVDPYAALTVESNFYTEYPEPFETKYLSPLLITESAGVGRHLIEEEHRNLFSRVGFALRQDMVQVPNEDGTKLEGDTITEGGLEWVTDYTHTFAEERMKLVSKLRVFQAVFSSAKDDIWEANEITEDDDYWQGTDVAFESTLSASINEYIQMNLFVEWLYDKEVDLRGRFRETLGLGLTYKLF